MPDTQQAPSPLAALETPADYQAARAAIFPSRESLRWFVRRNRNRLADLGAIVAPAGSMLIDRERMDRAVAAIGRERVGGRESA